MLNMRLVDETAGAMRGRMGRRMQYPDKREAAFVAGTLARIRAVIKDSGNTLVGFIRDAVEEKLAREERDAD